MEDVKCLFFQLATVFGKCQSIIGYFSALRTVGLLFTPFSQVEWCLLQRDPFPRTGFEIYSPPQTFATPWWPVSVHGRGQQPLRGKEASQVDIKVTWSYPEHENMIVVCLRLAHLGAGFSRQACCRLDKNLTLANEMVASAIIALHLHLFRFEPMIESATVVHILTSV